MRSDGFQRAEQLFHEALAVPRDERERFIEQAAAGDEELRRRVQRLVMYASREAPTAAMLGDEGPGHEGRLRAFGFNGDSANARDAAGAGGGAGAGGLGLLHGVHGWLSTLLGETIGNYRVVELIAQGGFGAVFRAEQREPVQRMVALKVLHAGLDSEQVLARFEAERQALAMMEHPGIARIFDAGTTGQAQGSRPYFVMELVDGPPITEYCDRHKVNLSQRLELFIKVCQAVEHAHQKGIVHRDLKPSNVLVTEVDGRGEPRVIDFGIAKAMQGPLAGVSAAVTEARQLLGTPQYMSPEQADPGPQGVDTRSDIYSLGAILYQLLTGATPLDATSIGGASLSELQRRIVHTPAERPSLRARHPEHRRRLRGDLDWITLKSLEKDRSRRYDSVSEFANDLRRHLRHEPVLAGPPTARYRLGKFIRRHRVGAAAALLVGLAIVIGAAAVGVSALRVRDAARQTDAINLYMLELLSSPDPNQQGADMKLADLLKKATVKASERFAKFPEVEAQLHLMLCKVMGNLGMRREAVLAAARAETIWTSVAGAEDARTLQAGVLRAKMESSGARNRQVIRILDELQPRIDKLGPRHAVALEAARLRGSALTVLGNHEEGERVLRAALARARRVGGLEPLVTDLASELAQCLIYKHRYVPETDRVANAAEVETLAREVLDRSVRHFGAESTHAIEARMALGTVLHQHGQWAEAAEVSQWVLELDAGRIGECHTLRSRAKNTLSQSVYRLGDADRAAALQLDRLSCMRTASEPLVVLGAICDALPFLHQAGRFAEGEALAAEAVALLREYGGGHGLAMVSTESYLAQAISAVGRLDQADALFAALMARQNEWRDDRFVAAQMHMHYGAHLRRRGDFEAAQRELQAARQILGEEHRGTWSTVPDDVIAEFVRLYDDWHKPEQAASYRQLREEVLRDASAMTF